MHWAGRVRRAAAAEAATTAAALDEARLKAESDAVAFRNANEVARWEAEHPRAPATLQQRALPLREVEQLKALGYLP